MKRLSDDMDKMLSILEELRYNSNGIDFHRSKGYKAIARKAEDEIIGRVVNSLNDANMSTKDLSIFEKKVLSILDELQKELK